MLRPCGARILPDADLVILAGTEFDYRVGQLTPPVIRKDAAVIRIHVDAGRLRQGVNATLSIHGSPTTVLSQLTEACSHHSPVTEWLAEVRKRRNAYRENFNARANRISRLSGRDVVEAIRNVATDNTVLLVDGGNIGQWFHQLLTDRLPGHWVTCGASGVVGWGLPGALAARAAYPDRPVILLSGDGSFTFTIAELECAARQRLPFVAVVADDEEWGISVTVHKQEHGHPLFSTLGPTRLDQVAEGFGCRGVRVKTKDELMPAIRAGMQADRPTVIHVPIVPSSPADRASE